MTEDKKQTDGQSGFKVTDKRHFTSEGDVIEGAGGEEAAPAGQPSGAPVAEEPEISPAKEPPVEEPPRDRPSDERPREGGSEKVDFSHLVMSLAGTAYHSLGMPDPVTKEKGQVDLAAASQMIDLLAVLDEKTSGNLLPQEEQILKGILTELRALFVQASGFRSRP